MIKKTILGALILIFSSVVLLVLLEYWNVWRYFNGDNFLGSGNSSIEQIIVKSIKIQYREGDKKNLDRIFTPDFIKKIDSNPYFYKKKLFYIINNDFMDSFRNLNRDYATVSVRVEDLSGSYIQIIMLTRDANGNYLISEIEFDI